MYQVVTQLRSCRWRREEQRKDKNVIKCKKVCGAVLQNRCCSRVARSLTYAFLFFVRGIICSSAFAIWINSSSAELRQATLSAFAVKWLHNDISSEITSDWNSVAPCETRTDSSAETFIPLIHSLTSHDQSIHMCWLFPWQPPLSENSLPFVYLFSLRY